MRPWLLPVLAALAACGRREPLPITPDPARLPVVVAPASAPASEEAPPPALPAAPPAPAPAEVARVDVPGDSPASLVRAADGSPPRILFLPGVCSNAYAYLLSFPEAARAHGGIVAIDGDRPCGAAGSGFRSFSWDPARQDARLHAALEAVGGGAEPPEGGYILVGYSAGAGIGERMVQRWPRRYARVVLIGAPSDPSPALLAKARGVVTMSCSRDVPGRMRDGARHIAAAGVPAEYVEMPGCTHGNIADGERVFSDAFEWLTANAKD
ncbi:MAG TPA: alpha/beta hydrolase [Polyangiaceae bacterium]|jgi:pimeloyl-ACP methyl ester carboxylesterase